MGTTIGNKDIATTGSSHKVMTPPAVSMVPPVPPGPGPVPAPFPYMSDTSSASSTESKLEAAGDPVVVKGSILDVQPPANAPSTPPGIKDVVTHAMQGKVNVTEGSSNTKANGKEVSATGDGTAVNVLTGHEQVAQEANMPLIKAGGADMAGDKDGEDAEGGKKGKSAVPPSQAKCESDPVDVATGRVIDEGVDLSLPGVIPLVWKRNYASASAAERGALGRGGWSHSFEQWIDEDDEATTLHAEDGRTLYFPRLAPGESAFLRSERLTLTAERGGGFTVRDAATRLSRTFTPPAKGGRAVLRSVRDSYGHAIELSYEGESLVRIVDTTGREIRVKSDERGRVARVEVWATAPPPAQAEPGAKAPAPALEVWFDYAYGDGGELASATNALGHAERYAYDGRHRMVTKTLKNGVSFHYEYDEETGWCVRAWGDGGIQRISLKPDFEKKTTHTSGSTEPRVYTWNDDGLVVREETLDGGFVQERKYDADRYLLSEANAAGEKTEYAYDERGNRIKMIDPAGNESTWEYADDLLVRHTGPDALSTTRAYDGHGALVGVTHPTGASYALTRDRDGRLTTIRGAEGFVAGFSYDARHAMVEETDGRGARTRYAYDALGRPAVRVDALGGRTAAEYDRIGLPTALHFPDGAVVRFEHDALGNIRRFVDPRGAATTMEFAGTGVIARLTAADGQTWHFLRDDDERLRKIKNPRGEVYELDYDRAGRLERERTFDGRVLEYRYGKAGRLARIDYPDGTWRELAHDPLGHVIEDRSPHGSITFDRDPLGRIKSAALEELGSRIVNVFERDPHGRVVAETQGDRTIRYAYAPSGPRASRVMPGGQTTRYYHDAWGALAALDHDGYKVTIERDTLGREVRRHLYRGQVDIQCAYDARGRLVDQRVTAPSQAGGGAHTVLSLRRWGYDANGRVQRIDDQRWGSTVCDYDPVGQLVEMRRGSYHEVFSYDPAGSLLSMLGGLDSTAGEPWSVGAGNVLERAGNARYENDARGRRVKKVSRAQDAAGAITDAVTEYDWDCRDRLREVRLPSGERVRFTYDAFGRRVRKEVIPAERQRYAEAVGVVLDKGKGALARSRIVEFLWDGDALCAEIEDGEETRVFVHHPGGLVPILQQEKGEIFSYVNDHLGMPRELVDGDGRVAWAAAHTAWGRVTSSWRDPKARQATSSPFRLLGQYEDAETGLSSTRFRYFDAEVGRFCSPDPLGIDGGTNAFAFEGSPTTTVDPLGLSGCPRRFFVVVDPADAARLRGGGEPFPSEPNRSALGEGVYAWGSREEAEGYMARLSSRAPDLEIMSFTVPEETLASFKQVNVDSLPDPDAWMTQHSKLWGGTPDPSIEYVQRQTAIGQENYFNKSVFPQLGWD